VGNDKANARLADLIDQYGRLIDAVIGGLMRGRLAYARDDVRQEVAIALWKRLQDETPIEHPTSYVYQVARREAIRILQREARRYCEMPEDSDAAPSSDSGPFGRLEVAELRARLNGALGSLAPERRQAVRAHLMGFNIREIMAMRGWTYQTARNLVARGMAEVRAILSAEASK
jgi:RNA polymerase sigma factor (sigma-70 family)